MFPPGVGTHSPAHCKRDKLLCLAAVDAPTDAAFALSAMRRDLFGGRVGRRRRPAVRCCRGFAQHGNDARYRTVAERPSHPPAVSCLGCPGQRANTLAPIRDGHLGHTLTGQSSQCCHLALLTLAMRPVPTGCKGVPPAARLRSQAAQRQKTPGFPLSSGHRRQPLPPPPRRGPIPSIRPRVRGRCHPTRRRSL